MSSCASSFASSSGLRHSRRRPLAAGVSALFALSVPAAIAAPPAVTNCSDNNTGSLRAAVTGATSGDTIDMSALSCGTITLTTGAIVVGQEKLTLHGPGMKTLTIYAAPSSRVIVHNYMGSTGHLYVDNLSVGFASISSSGSLHGGCIASLAGSLTLSNVGAYHCSITTTAAANANALGGAVFAANVLTISSSVLLHNSVSASNAGVPAQGGCAATLGAFDMTDSSIAYCSATGPIGSTKVHGGALELRGDVKITGSIIGVSYSSYAGGGVDIFNMTPGSFTTTISNSTITFNQAHDFVGGLYADSGTVNISNSTIVFNQAGSYVYGAPTHFRAPGVTVISSSSPVALSLQGTIIANNSSGSTQEDLATGAFAGVTISGSNNLVRAYKNDVILPSGQGNLTGVCPLLGPIRDNGGTTYTHALLSGSPAIDAGNNSANDPHTGLPALYDGRGFPYVRESGGVADIGAYEVQKNDIVFNAGLDGCP